MRITSKGQVTIPLHVREMLGLLPNTEVEFDLDVRNGVARIRKAADGKRLSRGQELIAHMKGKATRRITTDDIMRLTRG